MDIKAIDLEIIRLQEQRAEAEKLAKAEGAEVYKNFVKEYDYSVTWPHPAQFRVERKATKETLDKISEFRQKYPLNSPPMIFEGSMTYSVLEGGYVIGGGGSVIVEFDSSERYRSSFDPQPISSEVLKALRAGVVPEEIKLR